ncbi:MAG: hypothetical protein ACOYKD_10050 [Anaerolineaceae bacterium]|jgi:hypothetical protein
MENNKLNRKIHWLSILAMFVVAAALVGMVYLALRMGIGSKARSMAEAQTPAITLIPAPTLTPVRPVPTLLPTATPVADFLLPPGTKGVGAYVKVANTQGVGLKIRSGAGTSSGINFVAMDEEMFKIVNGPTTLDGYNWWQLEAPYDQTRAGWAADNFLEVVDLSTPTP